ncbi:MAG: hypothetical protein RL701_6388, partial [Pseudomonadota bacterium]
MEFLKYFNRTALVGSLAIAAVGCVAESASFGEENVELSAQRQEYVDSVNG